MSRLDPLLFLDIDGVISLFGFGPAAAVPGRFVSVDGIPHFLSTQAARLITELRPQFDLVWCSGWEERADEHLPHALGLPVGLPHLRFAPGPGPDGRHWKLAAIDAFAGPRRPLAWVDDAHDDTCRSWAHDRPGPTLLVATDPSVGLTPAHRDRLGAWARSLGPAPDPP